MAGTYQIPLKDGPLEGFVAMLQFRPLDGETHYFSDKSIDERLAAPFEYVHFYEFSEWRRAFIFQGKTDIRVQRAD
jgi:hypothetical protein